MDTSKVYGAGNHFIGPDYEFKKFRADSHNVVLDKISAFTRDKLEVCVQCDVMFCAVNVTFNNSRQSKDTCTV